ncbi:MAG TPA: SsrA-binding protein SmpB [Bacteriovoracaceae bacterium]|nr:SsrA-binding protein SmpB [Bacteriovoracaceae bacterium]
MGIKIISKNQRAGYDYFIEEKYECGLVLLGTEVKSLRQGKAMIAEAFVTIDSKGEVWLQNATIPQYDFGNINNHVETRKRKLLMKREEVHQMEKRMAMKGFSIIALALYFKDSLVKCEIALAKGKKLFDKRDSAAKKDVERKLRQGQFE